MWSSARLLWLLKVLFRLCGHQKPIRHALAKSCEIVGFAERNAINAPIQGSAADMIKVAMINIHQFMKEQNLQSRMILQVHDELVFDAHKDEVELLRAKVNELMTTAIPLAVKMETGIGVGNNWLEAH